MLAPRWRKVLADLGANLTRTILAVLSIAVGVFGIGMVAGTSVLTQRDLAASYAAANPAAIEVRAWPGFDDELLAAVRHTSGAADAVGYGLATVRAEVAPGVWRNLVLFAVDDLEAMPVNRVRPDSGAWPVADRQILLERSGLGSVGYPVGSALTVELNDGERRAMRFAGTVFDATQVPTFFTDEVLGYITLDTLEWLGEPRAYNRVYVTVREGAGDRAIQQIVVAEGTLVGAISWAAAALLALPISRLLGDAIGVSFIGNPLPYAYSLRGVAIWLVVVLILAALASALPARRASRLTVRDVLAYE